MPGKHVSLKVPFSFASLGAIYYGIKMFALANGNVTTAQVIAVNVDFLPTIAAMLLNIAPAVILPVLAYVLYRLRDVVVDEGDHHIGVIFLTIVGLAAVLFSSIITLAFGLMLLVLHLLYRFSLKRNWKRSFKWARYRPDLGQLFFVSLTIPGILTSPSWIASEAAEIGGHQRVISVVKETGEYVLYLDQASDRVIHATPSDLSKREYCGSHDLFTVLSSVKYIVSGATYPPCPKVED